MIVVLAERDKEEMEMDIAKLEFDFMGTSVICRSGSPLILADLKKVHNYYLFLLFLKEVVHKDYLRDNIVFLLRLLICYFFQPLLTGFCLKGTGHYSFSC